MMRRTLLSVLCALMAATALFAGNITNEFSDAFYVYRNDGDFNGFLYHEIDSITMSYFDADSVRHSRPVMQVYHTPDTIVRIPIAAIDSVSFYQPEVRYKPNVFDLSADDHGFPQVEEFEGNVVTFEPAKPGQREPQVGMLLFDLSELRSMWPAENWSFGGRVEKVEKNSEGGCVATLGPIDDITDVFDQLIGVELIGELPDDPNNVRRRISRGSFSTEIGVNQYFHLDSIGTAKGFQFDLGGGIEGNIAFKVEFNITKESQSFKASLKHEWAVKASCNATFDFVGDDGLLTSSNGKLPFGQVYFPWCFPIFKLGAEAEPFLKFEGSASLGLTFTSPKCIFQTEMSYCNGTFGGSSRGIEKKISLDPPAFQANMKLAGSMHFGAQVTVAIGTIDCLGVLQGALELRVGPKLSGELNFDIVNTDNDQKISTSLYSALKDSKVELSFLAAEYELVGKATFMGHGVNRHKFASGGMQFFTFTRYLFPDFEDPEFLGYELENENGINFRKIAYRVKPSRSTILPVEIMLRWYDPKLDRYYYLDKRDFYQNSSFWSEDSFAETNPNGIDFVHGYYPCNSQIQPVIRLLGFDFPVDKGVEAEVEDLEVGQYVDLGLKSGTKWCTTDEGAQSLIELGPEMAFGDGSNLPSNSQAEELTMCTKEYLYGPQLFFEDLVDLPRYVVKFIGPNGNYIYIPDRTDIYGGGIVSNPRFCYEWFEDYDQDPPKPYRQPHIYHAGACVKGITDFDARHIRRHVK